MSYIAYENVRTSGAVKSPVTIFPALEEGQGVAEITCLWVCNTSKKDIFVNVKLVTAQGAGAPEEHWLFYSHPVYAGNSPNLLSSLIGKASEEKRVSFPSKFVLREGQSLKFFTNDFDQSADIVVYYSRFVE